MRRAEIIPAINAETFDELKAKIEIIEKELMPLKGGPNWVHIDVADGSFTENVLWNTASDLMSLKTLLNIEMHLMISGIDKEIHNWLAPNIKRNIIHYETSKKLEHVIGVCHRSGVMVGLSIGPKTNYMEIYDYTKNFWK